MKALSKKNIAALILLIQVCACSSAVNPFYNRHPQFGQSFAEKRPPRDNIYAEKGGYAKKKQIDPFQGQQSAYMPGIQQGLIGEVPQNYYSAEKQESSTQQTAGQSESKITADNSAPEKTNSGSAPSASTSVETLTKIINEQGSGDFGYSFYDLGDEIIAN
jgi:hypothetical protein